MGDYKALVIDDDRQMRESLEVLLQSVGFEVALLDRADHAFKKIIEFMPDVVLSDVRMPGMSGTAFLASAKRGEAPPIVLMSAHGDISMAVQAMQDGAYSFVEKPFDPRRMVTILTHAAERHRLSNNTKHLKARLAKLSSIDRLLVGEAPVMKRLRDDIVDLAPLEANILLVGETGTGKDLVANALHNLGNRADNPFVVVHCASFDFVRDRALLRRADGGTLFLDGLTSLSLEAQGQILRVIESGDLINVDGGTDKIDFRLIAAANTQLDQLRRSGHFRDDLYYRLNTIELALPALRDCPDDIPLLYVHFMRHFAAIYGVPLVEAPASQIADLMTQEWRGNGRELRNYCERQVLNLRRGGEHEPSIDMPNTLREAVAAFERQMIGRALAKYAGRMDDVAASLGIGRRTLNEKIVKLGLDKDALLGD